ncbi:helix-turn-helix domain-containing protein [Intestinimonas timonensis]|uniref:helix-turn-helix domain-containing protein n=1 Tax=Intestinimonas timonensis TaxID=1689270 RepID=UPI003A911317
MVTLGQRMEELRNERGLSRPALSAALGFPKNAAEKFETGRQTPTKEQQEKIAAYFGVSVFYLRGESSDRTRQEDWMDAAAFTDEEPVFVPKPAPKPKATEPVQGGMLDAMLASKGVQDLLRGMVLDVLKSPEGQAIIAQAVRKELKK